MSKTSDTATNPKIEDKNDQIHLKVNKNTSLSEVKKALPKADILARRKESKKLVIDGLSTMFIREKKRGRKAIVSQLCELSSNFSFSDDFPITSAKLHSYCEVLDIIDPPELTKSSYQYFYAPEPLSTEERKLRAIYALKQKAAFDDSNIKARQIVINGKADDLTADEIKKELKQQGITTPRGNAHSNTAITRLLQDYLSLRKGFDIDHLKRHSPDQTKTEEVYDATPSSKIQSQSNNYLDLYSMFDDREDRSTVKDKLMKLEFYGPIENPLHLDFLHNGDLIDSLRITPTDVRGNSLAIEILKDTVLFPGLYLVKPYTISNDGQSTREYQTPFELKLGQETLKVDSNIDFIEPTMPGKRPRIVRRQGI